MSNNFFKFKNFTIFQDDEVLKVSTDSVLLASFVDNNLKPNNILDIGAGTGLLSLAMASFFDNATIDAVEIDSHSYSFLIKNISLSKYSNRIKPYLQDIRHFKKLNYDLIITNPPFFSDMPLPHSSKKKLFKHLSTISIEELSKIIVNKLNTNGKLYIILSVKSFEKFRTFASAYKLYPSKIIEIKWTPKKNTERIIAEFTFDNSHSISKTNICIYDNNLNPTKEYIKLTSKLYLDSHFR